MTEKLPNYEVKNLAEVVEGLTSQQIDNLPFGAIRLGADGEVQYYSEAERRLSGSGDHPRVGLNFFLDIAPCMDSPHYRGRVEQAITRGVIDLEFTHIGDFEDRERELVVRIQSAASGGYWIFMQRDSIS
jgi:photoactive yellow protein